MFSPLLLQEEARQAYLRFVENGPGKNSWKKRLAVFLACIERHLAFHYGGQDEIEISKSLFRRSFLHLPSNPYDYWRHLACCPTLFDNERQIEDYWHKLNNELDEALETIPDRIDWRTLPRDGFMPSFNLPHLNKCCRIPKEKFAKLFKHAFAGFAPVRPATSPTSRKIRVGFLVTPGHEGGFVRMIGGVMERLNSERFDVFLFYDFRYEKVSGKIRRPFESTFEQTVNSIRFLELDVLYHWKVVADPLRVYLRIPSQ